MCVSVVANHEIFADLRRVRQHGHSRRRLTSFKKLDFGEGSNLTAKKTKAGREKESSSVFFENLRPKFLDWQPATEAEKALEVKARKDAREIELKRVTELANEREAAKAATRTRYRGAAAAKKKRKPG